jgi:hypothetical protein
MMRSGQYASATRQRQRYRTPDKSIMRAVLPSFTDDSVTRTTKSFNRRARRVQNSRVLAWLS